MTWFGWTLIAIQVIGTLSQIALIGRPRTPYTPMGALVSVSIGALLVFGVLYVGTGTLQ